MHHIAGNFQGRKLSQISKKWPYCRENFRGWLKNHKIHEFFSLESFFSAIRYTGKSCRFCSHVILPFFLIGWMTVMSSSTPNLCLGEQFYEKERKWIPHDHRNTISRKILMQHFEIISVLSLEVGSVLGKGRHWDKRRLSTPPEDPTPHPGCAPVDLHTISAAWRWVPSPRPAWLDIQCTLVGIQNHKFYKESAAFNSLVTKSAKAIEPGDEAIELHIHVQCWTASSSISMLHAEWMAQYKAKPLVRQDKAVVYWFSWSFWEGGAGTMGSFFFIHTY